MGAGITIRVDHEWVGRDLHDINQTRGVDFVDYSFGLSERDLVNETRFVETSPSSPCACVLYKEDLVGLRVPDNRLVEDGVARSLVGNERQLRVGADDIEELIIVNMKRLGLERFYRCPWWCEDLESHLSAGIHTRHKLCTGTETYSRHIGLRHWQHRWQHVEGLLIDALGLRRELVACGNGDRGSPRLRGCIHIDAGAEHGDSQGPKEHCVAGGEVARCATL